MDILVCVGSSCHLKGSRQVISAIDQLIKGNHLEDKLTLKGSFCMGKCGCKGISVKLDDEFFSLLPDEVDTFFRETDRKSVV